MYKIYFLATIVFCAAFSLAGCSSRNGEDKPPQVLNYYTPNEIGFDGLSNFSDARLVHDMLGWSKSGTEFAKKDEYESQDEYEKRWEDYFEKERETFGTPIVVYLSLGDVGNKNSDYGQSAVSVDFDANEKSATFRYNPKYFSRVLEVGLSSPNEELGQKHFAANYHTLTDLKCLSLEDATSYESTHKKIDLEMDAEQARDLNLLGKPQIYVVARVLMDPSSMMLEGAEFQNKIIPLNKNYSYDTDEKSGYLSTYPGGIFGNVSNELEILDSSKTPNFFNITRYSGYGDITDIMLIHTTTHEIVFTLPSCNQN